MFTIEQIKKAHSKVKTGADFPAYIQEMKILGVVAYEHFVTDGRIRYLGANDLNISTDAKWSAIEIAPAGEEEKLKNSLSAHQKGQTDYPTFCKEAAAAGVEKWLVDLLKMHCTYYDKTGNQLLIEVVPTP